jgi:hypothetical protein
VTENGLRILILGESSAAEMRGVLDAVLSCFPQVEIRLARSPSQMQDDSDWSPALIVVCQTWPDEFSRRDVLRLFARFPLARWVCCFGEWCESDGRNRDAWPIGVRVPARDALGRLLRERDVLLQGTPALPLTAGREEAFEFDGWCPDRSRSGRPVRTLDDQNASIKRLGGLRSGRAVRTYSIVRPTAAERTTGSLKAELQPIAAVRSPDGELRRCFEDRLREFAYGIAASVDDSDVDCVLFDADPWNAETAGTLRRLRQSHPDSAIIALMSFAPPEVVRRVTRGGADAVVSKLTADGALAAVVAETSAVQLPIEQVPDADDQLHEERHEEVHGSGEHQHN